MTAITSISRTSWQSSKKKGVNVRVKLLWSVKVEARITASKEHVHVSLTCVPSRNLFQSLSYLFLNRSLSLWSRELPNLRSYIPEIIYSYIFKSILWLKFNTLKYWFNMVSFNITAFQISQRKRNSSIKRLITLIITADLDRLP